MIPPLSVRSSAVEAAGTAAGRLGDGAVSKHPRASAPPALASTRPLSGAQQTEEANVTSYEGYCVKCREKRQFDGNEVELANGRRAAQGTCPTCGTKMNRILGKKA